MQYVYLAGGISGLTYKEAVTWRREVAAKLGKGISALSPMRAKEYLADETVIADSYKHTGTARGITCRDRNDVIRCNAVLVNLLDAPKVSIGSVIEIGWADILRKPVIVVMENHSIHDHTMIRDIAGYIVPTLQEGVRVINAILGEGA